MSPRDWKAVNRHLAREQERARQLLLSRPAIDARIRAGITTKKSVRFVLPKERVELP